MPHPTPQRPVVKDNAVYIGDGGRTYCGAHLGSSARYTGRDISGQEILEVTPTVLRLYVAPSDVGAIRCEECGREPSRLWIV